MSATAARPFVRRLAVQLVYSPAAPGRARAPRGAAARVALGTAAGLFALLTLALTAASETVKPEWRDPEYGYRLRALRRWQAGRPDRPLVLVLGSSRAQMGVSPVAMGFPDAPGAPLVYNLGMRGAPPAVACLQLNRARDDGARPRAVLLFVAGNEFRSCGPVADQLWQRRATLSAGDLRRVAAYTADARLAGHVRAARLNPWASRWELAAGEFVPRWRPGAGGLEARSWEKMDAHGFVPFWTEALSDGQARELRVRAREQAEASNRLPPDALAVRVLRDEVARCRADGLAVAVVWAPESPWYRALAAPIAPAAGAFVRELAAVPGVRVFPAPEHLAEDDFVDGFHLTPDGAAKYSRWLADTHLRPWLAEALP